MPGGGKLLRWPGFGQRPAARHVPASDPVGLAAMRMTGPVDSSRELGLQDHLCWVHGDPWDYRPRLSEFVR